jgi:hypothetical protein
MVMYLLVATTRNLNVLYWLRYVIHSIRFCLWKSHTYVYAVYYFFITVTILVKKDNAMNINIQLYAVDCRGRKHGITKRKLSDQFSLLVGKNETSISSCGEGAT